MARAVINFKVTDDGRDKGKVFVLTELPASKAERWAMKVIHALLSTGFQLPDGFENLGMAGIAALGLQGLSYLPWETVEPLLDEMWDCVQIMPDPSKTHIIRSLIDEDIEEIQTRIKLRKAVLELHTDFLKAVAP
jgi:hypothetical protein